MTPLAPGEVMKQVAEALPEGAREHVIIVGSLAAGYLFFAGESGRSIRTKDVDCMFSPHAKAVAVAEHVTDLLLHGNWTPREDGDWAQPGNEGTPDDQLPLIRLRAPGSAGESGWFLELLGGPGGDGERTRVFHRVRTRIGHFAICSFRYLALVEWRPLATPRGIRVARPEMMALANMLHHPGIAPDLIAGTTTRRSNKDLGRVLALAWLTVERDRRSGTDELDAWADRMADALRAHFPEHAPKLARDAGLGIRALVGSPGDLDEALAICNRGLLASMEVTRDAFRATGLRLIQRVVEPLADTRRV